MIEGFPCFRCPKGSQASGMFFPRLRFYGVDADGYPKSLYMTLHMAVCDAHKTPFVTVVLDAAKTSLFARPEERIADRFFERHGCYPDPVQTRVDWLRADHQDIVDSLARMKAQKDLLPENERRFALAIERCTFDELAEIMASAPDIAMRND